MGTSADADAEQADTEPAGIDWGIDMSSASATEPTEAAAGISWDIDMDAAGVCVTEDAAAASGTDAPADIDWGVEVADEGAAGAGGGEGISIDWDVGDDGDAGGTEPSIPEVAAADGSQSTHASGVTAAIIADSDFRNRSATVPTAKHGVRDSLHDSPQWRVIPHLGRLTAMTPSIAICSPACSSCVCRLLDDLHELRAFLLQRAAEQDSASPASLAAAMPEDLQLWETSGANSAAQASIDEALAVFTGPRATQLLMIQVCDFVL